jgi:hypothetical protein
VILRSLLLSLVLLAVPTAQPGESERSGPPAFQPVPGQIHDPAKFVLSPVEIRQVFTVDPGVSGYLDEGSVARSIGAPVEEVREVGWQNGYRVRYVRPSTGFFGGSALLRQIDSTTSIFERAEGAERIFELRYAQLPDGYRTFPIPVVDYRYLVPPEDYDPYLLRGPNQPAEMTIGAQSVGMSREVVGENGEPQIERRIVVRKNRLVFTFETLARADVDVAHAWTVFLALTVSNMVP